MDRCSVLRLLTLLFLTIAAAAGAAAWQWPLVAPRVVEDFAASGRGAFSAGVRISSSDPAVRAVSGGELVMLIRGGSIQNGRFPLGVDALVVLEHEDGWRTVYQNLSPAFPGASSGAARIPVAAGDRIGALASGAEETAPLVFQLRDIRNRTQVNPLLVLPPLPDDRVPVIVDSRLELPDGSYLSLEGRNDLDLPAARLQVRLSDVVGQRGAGGGAPAFPYEVKVILNGKLVYESVKQALRPTPGGLSLVRSSSGAYLAVYRPDGYADCGEIAFAEGMNRLEIRAADLAGNRTSAGFRVVRPVRAPAD